MKVSIDRTPRRSNVFRGRHLRRGALLGYLFVWTLTASLWAAPFDKLFDFTQPDGTRIRFHGRGDEFSARFETIEGYTVVFDQAQKAYCFARQDADGQLVSSGVQVQLGNPAALGLAKGVQMSDAARKQMVIERYQLWEQGMQTQKRWNLLKAAAAQFNAPPGGSGPQPAPPPSTTTGLKVGLTLLIDFSDDPATVPQASIIDFCNGDSYTGDGNNGSIKQYYYDNSNGLLTYTNVVTAYIRVPQPKTYYNDVTKDTGAQGNILLKDALDALKALPNYTTQILPLFDSLTVDNNNQVVACNAFFTGANSGVWMFGLWPHSWSLYNVGPQELSAGGKKVWSYQITDIGNALSIGTFCHENGHMLCGYPDLYDYQYDSIGGAGNFSLMASGNFDHNPVQIDAYLKRASGWATTTDLSYLSSLIATVSAPAGSNFNHFYRFQKPNVPTEYYLVENRQKSGRDALIPGSGIAIWHVDELGDRDNQNLNYNNIHANYELTLVQADNLWHFEKNVNSGDAQDLYYAGNTASGYANQFTDTTAPSARWWDGSLSGVQFGNFSHNAADMNFVIGTGGGGGVSLSLYTNYVFGGNGNGIIEFNECNSLDLILTNLGTASATGVSATLFTMTPDVAIAQPTSDYADIPAGASGTNLMPFKVSTAPSFVCGTPIDFSLLVRSDQGVGIYPFSVTTGLPGAPLRFDNNSLIPIPSPGSVSSPILVSNVNFGVNKVTVSMFVEDSFDYFLTLELIAPDGTTNLLSANNGLLGANYGLACSPEAQRTTFDDAATTPISAGLAPFVGSFIPSKPLSAFIGKAGTNINGVWQLRATDQASFDIAAIHCWSLFITPTLCADGGGECPGADLAVGITAQPNPVLLGNNLTYSIVVVNNGPASATNVTVTHLIPSGALFVSASSSQGTYAQAPGVVTFSIGRLGPRAAANMTVVALATTAGTIVSTATVSSEQPDYKPGNNSASVQTQVSPATADLAVALAAAPSPTLVGSTLIYTVAVTNNGPSSATGITVTNILPSSAAILSATGAVGSFTTVGQLVFWSLPGLASGAGATAAIAVVPTVEGTITATATAGGTEFDPITANSTATINTVVGPAADLAIGITGNPNPVVAGSNVLYLIAVTNFGPSVATGVLVNDSLPPSVSVVSTTPAQGTISISNSTLIWNVGTLGSAAKATLTVVVSTTTNGTLNSTATVIAAQADPHPANNSASVSTVVAPPFISVVAAGAVLTFESGPTNGAIDLGETVTMILRLRDAGNTSTRSLVATLLATNGVVPVPPNNPQTFGILFPSGFSVGRPFSFTASGANGGTISPTLLLQDGTNTYPLVSFSFTLPNTLVFTNSNVIVIPDPAAPNPPYPSESGPATPYPSAITVPNLIGVLGNVSVTLSNLSHTYPGDVNVLLVAPNGAKTMLMSHAGETATDVNLTFDDSAPGPLPATGQLSSGVWQPIAYSPAPGLGGFPTNAPAGPYAATLSTFNSLDPSGPWSLYVFDDHDGGSISNGWSLALTMITPVNQLADLALSAVAAPTNSILAGKTLTYTFSITNRGPNTATSVAFTNVLPAGVTLLSASPSQGNIITNATSLIVNLGTLATGTNATIIVVVTPTAAAIPQGLTNATLTSSANVAASETDVNPGNNSVSVVTVVNRPFAELGLTQTVAPDPVVVGHSLTNTVVITNNGPGTALSAVLTEPLPPGAGFIAASSSSTVGAFTNTGGAVTCILGDLASNATATVIIVLTNSAPGRMTNTVVLSTGSYDSNTNNNSSTYVATVVNPAPQIINAGAVLIDEESPRNGAIDPGETVTLSLGLANIGSLDTVNLKATLQASGGVTSPSGPQSYGSLSYGGPSAARAFSFKAAAVLGAGIVATLQLQDERPGVTTNNLGVVTFSFGSGGATNVFNSAAITIPDHGAGTPYPSMINISGVSGRVSKATLTLKGFTHAFPHDVNVLLVSPSGSNVLVMSHTGGGHAVTNLTLTFDDDAPAGRLSDKNPITSGTYTPSSYEGPVSLPGTAPARTYATNLSGMKWSNPNGFWSLYVYDDSTGDFGAILSGWSLNVTTIATVGPVMDLAVGMTVPASVDVGSPLTNTISLTNFGPDWATGAVLVNPLPAHASYDSASSWSSQGSLSSDGVRVTCNLGGFAAGGTAKVIIVTRPSIAVSLTNSVSVAANEEDLNPANNTAQAVTMTYGPATLSGFFSGGYFQLTVTAPPGFDYVVQGSTNLTSWVSLSTNSNPTGTFNYTDTTTPAPQQRFYRTLRR